MENIIKVLIVDDSVFARKVVADIVSSSPKLSVVGTANNGREAISLVDKLKPDVITMDIEMPELNGLDTLKVIMEKKPTPVVMLSSLTTAGAKESLLALKSGAVDVMAKPHGSHSLGLTAQRDELIGKI
ncbi:MAG: response regulator, partial [Armatimonadota bacterium]